MKEDSIKDSNNKAITYSFLFGKTQKQSLRGADVLSYDYLVRGGFIHQEMAGVFSLLPLGVRVLQNIERIVREEMNAVGGQEIIMPALHPKKNWQQTNRWDNFDALYKIKSNWSDSEFALGPTHEEIVVPLVKQYVSSYKDFPLYVYQIQTKFRDEPRAKSGIIRGREFGMKDLYSFHTSAGDLERYYEIVKQSYVKIFKRCGLSVKITEASGGSFTKKHSHEFMVVSEAGEDTIICCLNCSFAQNKEIANLTEKDRCLSCGHKLEWRKTIEVGNIFDLGKKFSDDFNLYFIDADGKRKPVLIGCYGLGTTRLIGAIAEVYNDERGLIWPEEVAPYQCYLIGLNLDDSAIKKFAEKIFNLLAKHGISVIFDDRLEVSAGEKFADADLIGLPVRLIVSKKTIKDGVIELKNRGEAKVKLIKEQELLKIF